MFRVLVPSLMMRLEDTFSTQQADQEDCPESTRSQNSLPPKEITGNECVFLVLTPVAVVLVRRGSSGAIAGLDCSFISVALSSISGTVNSFSSVTRFCQQI